MKPYIICHMMASVGGHIDCNMTDKISGNEYYAALDLLECPSQSSGKATARKHYVRSGHFAAHEQCVDRTIFYKAREVEGYAIVSDSSGTLLYDGNSLDGKPLLVTTSKQVAVDYLCLLKDRGISYTASTP